MKYKWCNCFVTLILLVDPKPWLLNKSGILGLLECYIGVGNERFMIPLFRNPVGPHQMASSTTSRISRTCTVRYVVSIFSSFKPAWWIPVFWEGFGARMCK